MAQSNCKRIQRQFWSRYQAFDCNWKILVWNRSNSRNWSRTSGTSRKRFARMANVSWAWAVGKLDQTTEQSELILSLCFDYRCSPIVWHTILFVLIDPLTTEYDSFVFDLAKLRQDLVCKWFIRNDNVYLDSKLYAIIDKLNGFVYNENHNLLILMLMRVLPYTHNEKDKEFLMTEVRRLWK